MAKKLKWGTIDNLNSMIDTYFEYEPLPSIAGLRLHLGIGHDCWSYYISEIWKTHRKTDEEKEEILKNQIDVIANEAFEELMEISPSMIINEYEGSSMNIEEDNIKRLVSDSLKKAKDRIDIFNYKAMMTAKNPAGPIFYAKAALGYREQDPIDNSNQQQLPSRITINILPSRTQPEILQAIEVKAIEGDK